MPPGLRKEWVGTLRSARRLFFREAGKSRWWLGPGWQRWAWVRGWPGNKIQHLEEMRSVRNNEEQGTRSGEQWSATAHALARGTRGEVSRQTVLTSESGPVADTSTLSSMGKVGNLGQQRPHPAPRAKATSLWELLPYACPNGLGHPGGGGRGKGPARVGTQCGEV